MPLALRRALAAGLIAVALPCVSFAAWQPNGTPVCVQPQAQYQVAITSDWAGGAIMAWEDFRTDPTEDLYAQRFDANGNAVWDPNGVPISTAALSQGEVKILPDLANGAVCAWSDFRTGIGIYDVYAQRISSAGGKMWDPDGVALATGSGSFNYRARGMISDGNPGVVTTPGYIVALTEDDQLGNGRVMVQHVDLTGGGLWAPASTGGNYLTTVWRPRYGVRLVTDGLGTAFSAKGAFVVWYEDRPVTGYDICLRRVTNAGVPAGPAEGVAVCTLNATQMAPDLVNVGGNNVIVAWDDARNGNDDIYAQKVDVNGNMIWTPGGIPVYAGAGRQSDVRVVGDGAGGAIVVWHDTRNGIGSYRMYAQRIDGNGNRLWGDAAIPVTTVGNADWWEPRVETDLAGGLIAVWEDDRNDAGDVYAQRLDPNGNRMWGDAGMPLCVASLTQSFPVVVTDGVGGGIFAWADKRSGADDVYATRVTGPGGTVDAPVLATAQGDGAARLTITSANPTRGAMEFVVELARGAAVAVDVMDVAGRRVRALPVPGEMGAGSYRVRWDGRDRTGALVGAGTYFVRMTSAGGSDTERVVVLR